MVMKKKQVIRSGMVAGPISSVIHTYPVLVLMNIMIIGINSIPKMRILISPGLV